MIRFAALKLASAVATIVVVAMGSFALLRVAPGGPARLLLGVQDATPAAVAALNRQYGLDKPLPVQFLFWGREVLKGNLGTSITTGSSVNHLIGSRMGVTLELIACSLVLAIVLGILLGGLGATFPGTADAGIRAGTMVMLAVPGFAFAIALEALFGFTLPGILPYSGWVSLAASPFGNLQHVILPAVTLGLAPSAIVARMTRASMLEARESDPVWYARSWGMSERRIVVIYVLPAALTPLIPTIGLLAATSIGGAIVVETVFNLPGLGSLLVGSITSRDYPVISGVLLILAIVAVGSSAMADIVNVLIDPRQRRRRSSSTRSLRRGSGKEAGPHASRHSRRTRGKLELRDAP